MTARTEAMRDRWHSQPTWLRWTVGLIVAAIFYVLLQWWQESQRGYGRTWIVLGAAVVLLGLAFVQSGHRLGGRGQLRLLRRSLKEGRVLEGANVERWRIEVPRRARYLREYRVFAIVVFALEIVMVVALGVGLAVAEDVALGALVALPLAVMVTLFGVLVFVWMPRKRRRLEVLENELRVDR